MCTPSYINLANSICILHLRICTTNYRMWHVLLIRYRFVIVSFKDTFTSTKDLPNTTWIILQIILITHITLKYGIRTSLTQNRPTYVTISNDGVLIFPPASDLRYLRYLQNVCTTMDIIRPTIEVTCTSSIYCYLYF